MTDEREDESNRLAAFLSSNKARDYRVVPDLMPSMTPKKSTVKLWVKSQSCFWNPENKVEYP